MPPTPSRPTPWAPSATAVLARSFLGAEIDLDEAYAWGWEELDRIEDDMRSSGGRDPARSVASPRRSTGSSTESDLAVEGEDDAAGLAAGADRRRRSPSSTAPTSTSPPPVQRVEAMIAPPGGAAAMYYTAAVARTSAARAAPGTRRWAGPASRCGARSRTCYHEGVPGHHLQIAQVGTAARRSCRGSSALGFISGHGEGWALYAERLMGELGYLDDPRTSSACWPPRRCGRCA